MGKPLLVTDRMIKDDCIVIDVGITVSDKIYGDTEFDKIIKRAKYITPVPGGVGRMTVVMLLRNVVKAWSQINKVDHLIYSK